MKIQNIIGWRDLMKFRPMEKMKYREIKNVLATINEEAILLAVKKHKKSNFISISYQVISYGSKIFHADLLPDEFQLHDAENCVKADGCWKYQQYMVAKGYSQLLLGNPFL